MPPQAIPPSEAGLQKIGKFEILAGLGQGAMGTVYRARDPILDRQVALKTISPEMLAKPDARARFEREARAAARLQHPNIVTIYELGEVQGTLYIAMELLDGMDLAEAMTPPGRLGLDQKLRIAVEACRGLDYAHKHGVLHRDVKPANIRLVKNGTVKIVDFGIARRQEDATMTQTGFVLGTPSYMAPEVLRVGQGDHRADMWAIGVVLYELLAGKRPFRAPTMPALMYQIVHEPLPPLDCASLGAPPGLREILDQALAKEPSRRFRDLGQMADAIQTVLGLTPSGDRPLSPAEREAAYLEHVAAAHQLFSQGDLEGALSLARQAQALEPSRTEIVVLLRRLEESLGELETEASAPIPTLDLELTPITTDRLGPKPGPAAPPRPRTAGAPPPPASEATAPPRPPGGSGTRPSARLLAELRARGAGAFRELALFGEPPATGTACVAPDGLRLATAGTDGSVRVWDLRTRVRTATLRTALHQRSGHDAASLCLAFSPDGSLLASGHADGAVHLWDLAKGAEIPVKLRHEAMVGAVAFSPDGVSLASGGMDSNLKLWEVRAACSGEARRELHRQPSGVTALAYLGERLLVTGHSKAVLRVVDARSCRLLATLRGPEAQVSLLAASPDARRLAAASHDRSIRVYEMETRAELMRAPGHRTRNTASLAFFTDGLYLASVALDNSVQLWDLAKGAAVAALWGQSTESFAAIAVYGGGDHLAAALTDGRIRLWGPAP